MALLERIKSIFTKGPSTAPSAKSTARAPAPVQAPTAWSPQLPATQRKAMLVEALTASTLRPDLKAALLEGEALTGFARPPSQALLYAQSVHDICFAAVAGCRNTTVAERNRAVAYIKKGTPLESARTELLEQRAAADEAIGELITSHPHPSGRNVGSQADDVYARRRQGK